MILQYANPYCSLLSKNTPTFLDWLWRRDAICLHELMLFFNDEWRHLFLLQNTNFGAFASLLQSFHSSAVKGCGIGACHEKTVHRLCDMFAATSVKVSRASRRRTCRSFSQEKEYRGCLDGVHAIGRNGLWSIDSRLTTGPSNWTGKAVFPVSQRVVRYPRLTWMWNAQN